MEAITNTKTADETSFQNFFTGSVPGNYDTYMGPILFTPYAIDLAARIKVHGTAKILELAAGTGRVTKEIITHLSKDSQLIATDISIDMMQIAQETISSPNVTWIVADMNNIPYEDDEFDLIVCGFGLMFVPDKIHALTEMHRVLKTGGQLLLSTWGKMEENPMWQTGFETLTSFLGDMPFPKDSGPFALTDEQAVLSMMHKAGFINTKAEQVRKTSMIETASLAARSFLMTSPALAKAPDLFPQIQEALAHNLKERLGDNPLQAPLLALVFEATK